MTAGEQVSWVFFDFAGTLFDDRELRENHLAQLRRVAKSCRIALPDSELRQAYRHGMATAYTSLARGRYYRHRDLFTTAYQEMASAIGGTLTGTAASDIVDCQYEGTLANVRLRPEAEPTLRALRDRGVRTQIVSNIDADQLDSLITHLKMAPLLTAWTSSEEAQSCKPDCEIFEIALRKAQCSPSAVLFVGDTLAHDIRPAAKIGMRTAWLRTDPGREGGDLGRTNVVSNLTEVLTYL